MTYLLTFAFGMLFASVNAQQPALEARFANTSPRYVRVGDKNIAFSCKINRILAFMLKNPVEIVRRVKGADGKVTDSVLTLAAMNVDGEPSFYEVNVNENGGVDFKIVTVRDIDDGQIVCRVKEAVTGASSEMSVDIYVLRPLKKVSLQFDNLPAIERSIDVPHEVDAGQYSVKCVAEGSNPSTKDVHVYLHGNKMVHSEPVIEQITGPQRMFRTSIAAKVDIKTSNSGQDIECSASSMAGEKISVRLPIKVKIYEPNVTCEETKAHLGMMYPVLSCTVDHTGLNIKDYKYELGNTGEVIADGSQNDKFMEVTSEQISDTKTKVKLNLYKAVEWHFDSKFYLLIEHADGHVSRASVILVKVTGPDDASSKLTASVATLLLALVCTLFRSP